MGSCFSSETDTVTPSTAKIITTNGALREYSVPVTVEQVLKAETASPSSFFICNSDNLYFDSYIPSLDLKEELQVGQIYFLLPVVKLQYRLTASGMAALAVKASTALVEGSKKGSRRRSKKVRISPVLDMGQGFGDGEFDGLERFEKMNVGLERSRSVRKLQRSASRKAKMAYRSFRIRLSTIHEGAVAE